MYATSVWGGVFPFLPLEFQTPSVTLTFFAAQAVASALFYAAGALCAYRLPSILDRTLPFLGAPPMIAGSCALIASMYVGMATLQLIVGAGLLLGLGSVGMYLLWQRVLAAHDRDSSAMIVIRGTALSALIYFALYLCPTAVTAFLVPLVFLPLCGTALSISLRALPARATVGGDGEDGDVPREHPRVYAGVLRDYWRSALVVGALGFITGAIRQTALTNSELIQVVNVTSMAGALISAVALLIAWRRLSFRFSLTATMRIAFPLLACALTLLPFLSMRYLDAFAGLTHMAFAFVQMVLLVQCAQVAHDRGVDPAFVYGFCGGVASVMQCLGFLCGWGADAITGEGVHQATLVAVLCLFVLGMAFYAICLSTYPGVSRPGASPQDQQQHSDAVEFLALTGLAASSQATSHHVTDRISKQCEAIRLHYRLSARETEVMEHIARGDTVPRIASELEVSENTVRTHAKRIYAKLGIHSKQELGDLIAQFRPADV